MISLHMRDPVDGASVSWDEAFGDNLPWMYWDLARRHQITIAELYKVTSVILWGPDSLNNPVEPWAELQERQHQAEIDAELLKLPMPVEQALKIWDRNCEGLRWLAERFPAKRAEIEVMIEQRRTAMKSLRERFRGAR
jgi:hypothetical protein